MSEPRERLRDAIAGERRDWHVVEVRPDDLAAVLDSPPDGWAWQCAGCDRPVPPMGMCETCGVFGIMRTIDATNTLDLDSPETVERLAAVEHDQWMTWARSVMSADDVTIGPERLARWQSYMVPYADLSEPVKEHDRKWARGVLAALREGGTA